MPEYPTEPILNARTPEEYFNEVNRIKFKGAKKAGFKIECLVCGSQNISKNYEFSNYYEDSDYVQLICVNCGEKEAI